MPTIDNKIVQMTFDNKQFEQGAKESIKTLEELKKALELDKAVRSLEGIETAANSLDLSHITNAVDEVSNRFTLMGRIGQRVFDEIAGGVVGAAKTVVSTITSMPDAGFAKYEAKNKAIQMIKSAIPDKSIEDVEKVIERLNYYTDWTSYDFSAMIHNIGKFTSVGVDLETAERAMEGIANVAASAGAEISQANIAMYNFSQAMATGAMKFVDWKSLNNAGISTKEFKEQAIQAAIELGRLQQTAEYAGVTAKGVAVDFRSFDQTLRYGWFDTEVMIRVLEEYADTSTYVGQKAWKAAKESITLGQAIISLKDAVSTGWMTTYQYIFGNLSEATKLFTDINEEIVKLAANIFNYRNGILKVWHENGEEFTGYQLAVKAFWNIWDSLTSVIYVATEAFQEIFGTVDQIGSSLYDATKAVYSFSEELKSFFGYFKFEDDDEDPADAVAEAAEEYEKFSEVIKRGDRSDEVMRMQTYLMGLGNDLIKLDKYGADGIFGPETQAAVKAFQKAFDLEETGILDENTGNRLIEEYMNRPIETISDIWEKDLKSGDKNEQVQKMQEMLLGLNNDLIKLDKSGADGIFGPETQAAVKAFQEQTGLEPTGIFDSATQQALIDAYTKTEEIAEETQERVEYTSVGAEGLRGIFRGIASLAKIIVNVFKLGLGIIGGVAKALMPVVAGVLAIGGAVGDALAFFAGFLDSMTESESVSSGLTRALDILAAPLKVVGDFLIGIATGIETIIDLAGGATSLEGIGQALFELDPEEHKFAYAIYGILVNIKSIVEEAKPYVEAFGAVLGSVFSMAFSWIGDKITKAIAKFGEFIKNLWKNIKEGNVIQKILGALLTIFKGLALAASAVVSAIGSFGKVLWNGAKMVWNFIANGELLKTIFGDIDKTVAPVKEELDKLFKAFEGFSLKNFATFEEFFDSFVSNLDKSNLTKWLVKPLQKMKGVLTKPAKLFSNVSGSIEKINSMSKKGMGLDAILATLKTNPEQNKTAIGIVNFLVTVRDIIRKIVDYGGALKVTLSTAFTSVWDRLKTFAGNIWDNLRKFFTPNEGESFGEMIAGKIAEVKETIEAKWQEVVDWVTDIVDKSPFLSGVVGGVKSIWDGAVDFFKPSEGETFASNLETNVKNTLGLLEKPAKEVINFFTGNDSLMEAYSLMEGDDVGLAEAKRQSGYDKTLPGIVEKLKLKFITIKNDLEKWWKEFSSDPIVSAGIKFVESVWGNIVEFFTPREGEDLPTYILNRVIEVKTGIRGAVDTVKAFCETIISNPIVQGVFGFFTSIWGNILDFFAPDENGKTFSERVHEVVKSIQLDILVVYAQLLVWWDSFKRTPIGATISGWADSIWASVVAFFEPTEEGQDLPTYLLSKVGEIKGLITKNVIPSVKSFYDGLKSSNPIVGGVLTFAESIWGAVYQFFEPKEGDEDFPTYLKNRVKLIADAINDAVASIKEFITGNKSYEQYLEFLDRGVTADNARKKSGYDKTLPGMIEGLRDNVPIIDGILNVLEPAWERLVTFLKGMGTKLGEVFTIDENSDKSPFEQLMANLNKLNPLGTWFDSFGKIIGNAKTNIENGFKSITEHEGGIIGFLVEQVNNMIKEIDTSGLDDLIDTLWDKGKKYLGYYLAFSAVKGLGGISNIIGNIANAMGFKFFSKGNFMTNFGGMISQIGSGMLKSGFGVLTMAAGLMLFIQAINDTIALAETMKTKGWDVGAFAGFLDSFIVLLIPVVAKAIANFGGTGISSGKSGVSVKIDGLMSMALSLWMIINALKTMYNLVNDADYNQDAMDKAIKTVKDLLWAFVGADTVRTLATTIPDLIRDLFSIFKGSGFKVSETGQIIEGTGVVGVAYAIKITVESIKEMLDIVNGLPIEDVKDETGKVIGQEKVFTWLDKAVGYIEGLLWSFTGSEMATKLVGLLAKSGFKTNVLGALTEGSGVVGIAYAVSMMVDAIKKLLEVIDILPETQDLENPESKVKDFRNLDKIVSIIRSLVRTFSLSDLFGSLKDVALNFFKGGSGTSLDFIGKFETGAAGKLAKATGIAGIIASIVWLVDTMADSMVKLKDVDPRIVDSFGGVIQSISNITNIFGSISSIVQSGENAFSKNKTASLITAGSELLSTLGEVLQTAALNDLIRTLADEMVKVKDVDPNVIESFGITIEHLFTGMAIFLGANGLLSGAAQLLSTVDKKTGTAVTVGQILGELGSSGAFDLMSVGATQIMTALGDAISKLPPDVNPTQMDAYATTLNSVLTYIAAFLGTSGGVGALLGAVTSFAPGLGLGMAAGELLSQIAESKIFDSMAGSISTLAVGLAQALAYVPKDLDAESMSVFADILSAIAGGLGEIRVEWFEAITGGESVLEKAGPELIDFAKSITGDGDNEGLAGILKDFHYDDRGIQDAMQLLTDFTDLRIQLLEAGKGVTWTGDIYTFAEQLAGSIGVITDDIVKKMSDQTYQTAFTNVTSLFKSVALIMDIIGNGITINEQVVSDSAGSVVSNLYNALVARASDFEQIGMYIDFGLAEGLSSYQSVSIVQAVAVAKACYDAACHFLGVNSPSKEFAWIGQQLNAGLAQGLYKYAGLASSASTDVASSALDGAKEGLSGYDTSLFDGLDANPVISPVLDLSNISDGASRIGGLIGNRYSVGVSGANLANRINVGSVASVRSGGTSNQDMAAAIDTLSLRMDQLGNAISNMKVVTDTGVLLGVVVPGVDSALGELEYMNSRGI